MATIPSERRDHFQITRGIACLMVFANHIFGRLSDFLPKDSVDPWVAPFLVPVGFPWVWLFLVLSGYLLTKGFISARYSLDFQGVRQFWWARLWRLLPLMWFVGLMWFALNALDLWSPMIPKPELGRELGIALCLPWIPYFQGTFPIGSANSPVWSAVIEVHFSILLPCLLLVVGLSARRLGMLVIYWFICMLGLLAFVLTRGEPDIFPFIYGEHLYNVGFFLAGGYLATSPKKGAVERISWVVVVCVAVIALGIVQFSAFRQLNITLAWSPLLMLPVWCLVVGKLNDTYQARLPETWADLLGEKTRSLAMCLERIGMMSYSLYLAHKPIGYILVERLGFVGWVASVPTLLVAALLCLLVSLPIYGALFLLIERKFRAPRHLDLNRVKA